MQGGAARHGSIESQPVRTDEWKDDSQMTLLNTVVEHIRSEEHGQGLVEYILILALIAIVAIVALIFLGGQVDTILSTIGDSA